MKNNLLPFILGIICTISLGAATINPDKPKQVYVKMLSTRSSDNVIRDMYTKGWVLKSMVYNPNYVDMNTSVVGAVFIVMKNTNSLKNYLNLIYA